MIWTNSDDLFQEESQNHSSLESQSNGTTMIDELEEVKSTQLSKFQDPSNNIQRQSYIQIASYFGHLLVNNDFDEMISTLLTHDCEFFIFNSTGRTHVLHSPNPKSIYGLIRGTKVVERKVGETYVDLLKSTVIQSSHCKMQYDDEDGLIEEVVIELFTINNNRISKYRAFFARKQPIHGDLDPFERLRKDNILAKVKQINYALADQSDLEKVASFFSENTQYKVWSWESQKCFTFNKYNFAQNFRTLEENFRIKCIVPYGIFTDTQYAVGTYVYYLEGISGQYENQKYIWLTTSVYAFDQDVNIVKISQQGELHREGEIEIPFEVYTYDKLVDRVNEINESIRPNLDLFYNNSMHFACPIYRYGPVGMPFVGYYSGIDKIGEAIMKGNIVRVPMDFRKVIDVFVDSHDPSYDVVIPIHCSQRKFTSENDKKEALNILQASILSLENGKVAKMIAISSDIPEPITSPFDDMEFSTANIIPKRSVE